MQTPTLHHRWLAAWICLTCIPFLPLYWPLFMKLFSDTPDAYLCLVPMFAMIWAVRSLRDAPGGYQNDAEVNIILGGVLSIVIMFVLFFAPSHFSLTFYGQGLSLGLWPLWGLACAWFMFGVGVSRWLWRPLAFLCFAVPSLYHLISDAAESVLGRLTDAALHVACQMLPWVQWKGQAGKVLDHQHWIPISITTACTGADSVMAVAIVLVFLLAGCRGNRWRKAALIIVGMLCAVVMNCIRVLALVWILHVWGSGRAFDDVHALLGLVLFLCMAYVLVITMQRLGLRPRSTAVSSGLSLPQRGGTAAAVVIGLILTAVIGYASYANQTDVWTEQTTKTDIAHGAYPLISGYTMTSIGRFDDSSVLGKGAHSYAMAYSNPLSRGYYRVEAWTAPSGWRLQQYGVNDCLIFHGDTVLSRRNLDLAGHLHARLFMVAVPPLQRGQGEDIYGVIAFTFMDASASQDGAEAYERIEISTPLQRDVRSGNLQPTTGDSLQQFATRFTQGLLR